MRTKTQIANISISKVHGTAKLVGEEQIHSKFLSLNISFASMLNSDRTYANKTILNCDFSNNQFSELLMNDFDSGNTYGVPITIKQIHDNHFHAPRIMEQKDAYHNIFKDKIKDIYFGNINDSINQVIQNLNNSKVARKKMLEKIIDPLINSLDEIQLLVNDEFNKLLEQKYSNKESETKQRLKKLIFGKDVYFNAKKLPYQPDTVVDDKFGLVFLKNLDGNQDYVLDDDAVSGKCLSFYKAVLIKSENRLEPTELICELKLSSFQFNELITGFNMGSGFPCTLIDVIDKEFEIIKILDTLDYELEKTQDRVYNISEDITRHLKDILNTDKGKSKKDLDILLGECKFIYTMFVSNLSYNVEELFEHIDKHFTKKKINFTSLVRNNQLSQTKNNVLENTLKILGEN
jgi:hypothetical protein